MVLDLTAEVLKTSANVNILSMLVTDDFVHGVAREGQGGEPEERDGPGRSRHSKARAERDRDKERAHPGKEAAAWRTRWICD